MSSLQEIKTECIRIYEGIASRRGLPTLLGRIMAVFFLEGRELSQKEVSDLTEYSVSSVSRTLDQMFRMGIVHRHKDPSLGHFVYHMNIDYRDLAIGGLETWIRQAEASKEEIKNLRRKVNALKLKGGEEAETNRLHAMLKDMEEKLESVLDIIKKDIRELERSKT